jgi:peroxiredoxin
VTEHKVGTREEWQAARNELLEREKELTRRNDELSRERRELPWVPIEKHYSFATDGGTKSLAELFDGRSQLLVYHFMFGPAYADGCPVCSSAADTFEGAVEHLKARDTTFLCVSRAPLDRLQAYERRMGWKLPWVSSAGSDFNFDFGVSYTEEQVAPFLEGELGPVPRAGGRVRDGPGRIPERGAGTERLRALRRCRPPHLLDLCARPRVHDGLLWIARPGTDGTQRGRPAGVLDPPPRRVLI